MVIQYSDEVLLAMDEAERRALKMLALVGLATLNWTSVEEVLERLIWHYLGSREVGHVVTSKMQNMSRCDALLAIADIREAMPQIRERIEHFVAAFDILRLNRNALVHSVSFRLSHKDDTLWLERVRKSVRNREYDSYSLPVERLEALADQMADLEDFGKTLLSIMERRGGFIDQPFF